MIAPLRGQLAQVSGVKSISSDSRMDVGNILLKFEPGANIDMLFIEVNEKIDMAMGNMPKDVVRPKVIKASASDIPAFSSTSLSVVNHRGRRLRQSLPN